MIRKVLVANRGEVAVRILRTCQRLGLQTVAVFSDADADSLPTRLADQAVRLGPPPVKESYLNVAAVLEAARQTNADAIHPGYGLLSENRGFAEAVRQAGRCFLGPSLRALDAFGDKLKARALARSVGVNPPPGSDDAIHPADEDALRRLASAIGYPLLVKAAAGGGGIGMQIVRNEGELGRSVRSCADRGANAFGDERVYLERYLDSPRHIEVQILCDGKGGALALGERECSVQRRHQKLVEESPSPAAFFAGTDGEKRRKELSEMALRVVNAVGYEGVGTVEFMASAAGEFWFLEVNARLQVEHPVTEMVTGLDLVEWQLRVAAGETLPQTFDPMPGGHAIEARLCAEDPAKNFFPQPGTLTQVVWPPTSNALRVETAVETGTIVTPYYDSLLAKIIAHGDTRAEARQRLDDALAATWIKLMGPRGPAETNLAFLRSVLAYPAFASGMYDTSIVETMGRS